MEYMVGAYTDKGIRKETNQDGYCFRRAVIEENKEAVFAAVCDGMGGLQKGELASGECIKAFCDWFDLNYYQMPFLCKIGFTQVKRNWYDTLVDVHNRLQSYSVQHEIRMGTTIAAFLAYKDRYLAMNVGDSRIYEHTGKLKQLTEDHSVVAREIALGRITKDEARHHPQRNVLLQCIGVGHSPTPFFREGRVKSGGLYLICTDGFVHEIGHSELENRLKAAPASEKEQLVTALAELTDICKKRGERDNITSLIIKAKKDRLIRESEKVFLHGLRRIIDKDNQKKRPTLAENVQIIHTHEKIKMQR